MSKNGIFWHFMTHGIFHNIDKIWHYGYQMNRLNNYNWYMKYENIFWIEFFTKNGNFAFDPIFLCIWAEIPLYLKYGESRVDLSSKVKFFAFSHYTIPTELHSIGKIWLARNLVFLTHPNTVFTSFNVLTVGQLYIRWHDNDLQFVIMTGSRLMISSRLR